MEVESSQPTDGASSKLLTSLLRISRHLAGHVEIRPALKAVKAEVESILPLDHFDVCLVDDAYWHTSYEVGLRTKWGRSRSSIESSPVRTILYGETSFMMTDDATVDPRYLFPGALSQPILQHKLRSRVNVAMKVLGRTIGALNCSSCQPGMYDASTVERVQQIADVLAPYFYSLMANEKAREAAVVRVEAQAREEGLRQGALELTRALEQERQRIGMDLHDQTLADLTRMLRDIEDGTVPLSRRKLKTRLQFCIQDLRRIIDTAVPSLLELFGFTHALRIHLERAVGDLPIGVSVTDRTDGQIDSIASTTRIALFRIAQEAINNAARHSGGASISVEIECGEDAFRLVVADDGRGFPVEGEPLDGATGGLAHMRTRARLIAARFEISSTKGGTRIAVSVPFAERPKTSTRRRTQS